MIQHWNKLSESERRGQNKTMHSIQYEEWAWINRWDEMRRGPGKPSSTKMDDFCESFNRPSSSAKIIMNRKYTRGSKLFNGKHNDLGKIRKVIRRSIWPLANRRWKKYEVESDKKWKWWEDQRGGRSNRTNRKYIWQFTNGNRRGSEQTESESDEKVNLVTKRWWEDQSGN